MRCDLGSYTWRFVRCLECKRMSEWDSGSWLLYVRGMYRSGSTYAICIEYCLNSSAAYPRFRIYLTYFALAIATRVGSFWGIYLYRDNLSIHRHEKEANDSFMLERNSNRDAIPRIIARWFIQKLIFSLSLTIEIKFYDSRKYYLRLFHYTMV